jgi:MYXO-CTERM domain-containing protein
MASAVLKAHKPARREHLARFVIAVSLAAGLAVATVSYLASSLSIPAPAQRAGTEELQARGAQVWVVFCSESAYEPRFWPECVHGPDEWRELGAERLVQFCTASVPSRLFTRNDCLAADRPIAGLSGGPQPEHAAAGVIGAAVAAAMVGGLAWYRRRRDT